MFSYGNALKPADLIYSCRSGLSLSIQNINRTLPHTELDALAVGVHIEVDGVAPHAGILGNGEAVARQLIDVIDDEPVPTIIEKGTMENFANNGDAVSNITTNDDGSGVITLENGQTVTFSSKRTMRGTAYTTGGSVGTRTASGTTVHVGVVAVDRSVLPLGTKVYVVSNDGMYVYGFAPFQ